MKIGSPCLFLTGRVGSRPGGVGALNAGGVFETARADDLVVLDGRGSQPSRQRRIAPRRATRMRCMSTSSPFCEPTGVRDKPFTAEVVCDRGAPTTRGGLPTANRSSGAA